MEIDPDILAKELASLRKGRATRHPDLLARLRPQVRNLCQIMDGDKAPVVRQKLTDTVRSLLRNEAREIELAVFAALALHPETDMRDLAVRQRWLAQQLACHERTARRRINEAFEIVVQRAIDRVDDNHDPDAAEPWQIQSVRAMFNLSRSTPELTEFRTLLFLKDGVDQIVTRFSLPKAHRQSDGPHELITEVLHGGRIARTDKEADEHFRYLIELPRRFRRAETHEYVIRFSIPPNQPMAPHYALVPFLTVKSLDLTIHFDQERLPSRILRLDGVPPRLIDNPKLTGEEYRPDKLGELRMGFQRLRQGRGYGARWEFP